MARAYAYAKGDGTLPEELRLARLVERFGAQSVYGRPLGAREIRNMELVENIIYWYQQKEAQNNQAEWANTYLAENAMLMHALKCAVDLGYIDGK